jgi:hypothetical protein
MGTRDVEIDFAYRPPTATTGEIFSTSIVGPPGTYLAPNSIDTSPLGAYLTEFTTSDTILSAGGINYFVERDLGGGLPLRLVIDWITAPAGGISVDMQLLTSNTSTMATSGFPAPLTSVILDFGAQPIAILVKGSRQLSELPRSANYQQFLGLQAVTVGAMTAGSYIAWLCTDIESQTMGYADGFSVK